MSAPSFLRRRVIPILAAGGLLFGATACGDSGTSSPGISGATADTRADYEYLIPAGTGERLDQGERVEIIPAELEVSVGEVLRIVNEDDRGHVIGAFYVGAGETLSQQFSTPGTLEGECSVHPSGSFSLTVRA
ncbi:MAG: hypothetical protein EA389_03930 [Ilumatobacter sp.]|nr:MAG: hypothetical protein EA389_03930 [Ilumatobacter sp.]